MPTQTTKLQYSKYATGESGWGAGVNANFDAIDASPLGYLAARPNSPVGMTLLVAAGVAYVTGTPIYFAQTASPTFTAPVSNPRIDLLVLQSGGTLQIVQGTENASPVPPAYPAGKMPICEVYLRVASTAIYATDQGSNAYIYRDVRPFAEFITGGASGVTGVHVQGNSDITGSVELVAGAGVSLGHNVPGANQISIINNGVRSLKMTGGTTFVGADMTLNPGTGILITEDAVNKILTISATSTGTMTNPMTAQNDMIVGGAAGAPGRLPVGTNGQYLGVVGGMPTWTSVPTGARAATRTVAAAASIASSRSGADYVCDGTADQVEINSAISDLASVGGGTLVLMEGIYSISAGITLGGAVVLRGENATIKIANGLNSNITMFTVLDATNGVIIKNLTLDGNKANNSSGTQSAIQVGFGCDTVIQDCNIQNFRSDAIIMKGNNSRLQGGNVFYNGGNGIILPSAASGVFITNVNFYQSTLANIYVQGSNRHYINGCLVVNAGQANILLDTAAADVTIASCSIESAVQQGVKILNAARTSIAGCRFFQNGLGADNTWAQVEINTGCDSSMITGSTFFKGAAGNKSKYGVWIKTGATNTYVYPNGFGGGGGTTADIQNDGSSSYLGPSVSTQKSNTYVVASSDATSAQKNGADYVCTGTGDEVTVQLALDAINTAGGGSLLLIGRNFTFANPAQVGSNTSIIGDSLPTIKWAASAGTGIGLFQKRAGAGTTSGVSFFGLVLDGNKANQTNANYGLYLDTFSDLRIEQVFIQNCKSNGLHLTNCTRSFLLQVVHTSNAGKGAYIYNCVQTTAVGCASNSNTGFGVEVNTGSYNTLINWQSLDNTGTGVELNSATSTALFGCTSRMTNATGGVTAFHAGGTQTTLFSGCAAKNAATGLLVDTSAQATVWQGGNINCGQCVRGTGLFYNLSVLSTVLQGYTAAVDTIFLDSLANRALIHGCTVDTQNVNANAIRINQVKQAKVSGCAIVGSDASSASLWLENSATDCTIENNTVVGIPYMGMYLINTVRPMISGNVITGTQWDGLSVNGTINGGMILNNRLYSNTHYGILVNTTTSTHLVIRGNSVSGSGGGYADGTSGIAVTSTAGPVKVDQNVVTDCLNFGITVNSPDCTVTANSVMNNGQGGINVAGGANVAVSENMVVGNSKRTTNTYDGIQVNGGSYVSLRDNQVDKGAVGQQHRYGINVVTASGIVRLDNNALDNAGATANFVNAWTKTKRAFGIVDITVPLASSNWTWVNQGSSTVTDANGTVMLAAVGTQPNLRLLARSAPTPPYTIRAMFQVAWSYQVSASYFLGWRNSGTGFLTGWWMRVDGSSTLQNYSSKWSSPTVNTANYSNFAPGQSGNPLWLAIQDNNTNRILLYSADGINWTTFDTQLRTDYMTPDQVVWGGESGGTARTNNVTLVSWEQI